MSCVKAVTVYELMITASLAASARQGIISMSGRGIPCRKCNFRVKLYMFVLHQKIAIHLMDQAQLSAIDCRVQC